MKTLFNKLFGSLTIVTFIAAPAMACLNLPTVKTYNSFFNHDSSLPDFEISFAAHGVVEVQGQTLIFDPKTQSWCTGHSNTCEKPLNGTIDLGNGLTATPTTSQNPTRYFLDIVHSSKSNDSISIEAVIGNGRVISTNAGRYNQRWIGPIYEEINGMATGKRSTETGNITGAAATRSLSLGGSEPKEGSSASAERVASTCGGEQNVAPAGGGRGSSTATVRK